MEWKKGYIIDVPYGHNFWPDCAPVRLAFSSLLHGYAPPPIYEFRALELGCGHGFQSALLAAGNPTGQFVAVDMNPAHTATGEGIKEALGLANLEFITATFDELLSSPVGQIGQFDYIILHGVYSWIDEESRRHVREALDKYAAQGALIYISYNAMPGCAGVSELQRFLLEYAKRNSGRSDQLVKSGFDYIKSLPKHDQNFFELDELVRARCFEADTDGGHYLAHEYLHSGWKAFPFGEVAEALQAKGFNFVGSTAPEAAFPDLQFRPDELAVLPENSDRTWREAVGDYLRCRAFRTDIFQRGDRSLTTDERLELLRCWSFGALIPPDDWGPTLQTRVGIQVADQAVLEALRPLFLAGMVRYGDVEVALRSTGANACADAIIAGLMGANLVQPAIEHSVTNTAARRFNALVLDHTPFGTQFTQLVWPAFGNGFAPSHHGALAISAINRLGSMTPSSLSEEIERLLADRSECLLLNGERIVDRIIARGEIARASTRFVERVAPLMTMAGVLHPPSGSSRHNM